MSRLLKHPLPRALGVLGLCLSLVHCANLAPAPGAVLGPSGAHQLFLPPPDQQLLIVGQLFDSAADERTWEGAPGGVMAYSRLGPPIDQYGPGNLPFGLQFIKRLAQRYPDSALQFGLYVSDQLEAINDGRLDANIDHLIEALVQLQRPVYLRFGYEFDGPWNPHEPEAYKRAWRHFRERLIASGARNIAMVWHSAADCGGTYGKRPLREWYPGDDAVDWVAISWFHPEPCNYAAPLDVAAFARAHHKPLMIAEATPRGYDLSSLRFSWDSRRFLPLNPDRIWDQWFVPFLRFVDLNADVLRVVCYINDNWDTMPGWGPPYARGYWGDARLEANPEILARWREEMRKPRWLKGGPALFQSLGIR